MHRLIAAGLALAALPFSALACDGRLHIELQQTGVYGLDYDAIVAQQPGLKDCTSERLELRSKGKEVPIRVSGRADGAFGPGARIEWIGRQLHGPESWFDMYAVDNVYILGAAPGEHARIVDAPSAGGGRAPLERSLHLEQENLMIRLDQMQQVPGEEPDVWQWSKLTQVDTTPFSTPLDLPDLAARGDVALTLDFRGLSELSPDYRYKGERPPDHTVAVSINGNAVATLTWNGRGEVRREIRVPASALKARGNTLALAVPKRDLPWAKGTDAVDVVMFNWIEAHYAIAGDLDAGALPFASSGDGAPELSYRGEGAPVLYGSDGVRRPGRAERGNRYAFAHAATDVELLPTLDDRLASPTRVRPIAKRASDWLHPAQPYDYLIVAHPKLIDAIRPLAEFHEKQGLKVAVLDVDDVYDAFNDGIVHPRAIRNLVDDAYHQWPAPQPRFVLLVGDASFDIRHDTYNDLNYAKWTGAELMFPNHFGSVAAQPYKNQPKNLADRNLIPTWQYPSPEGQSASDNWYGAVGVDWHPVVAVGRFPVVEPAEVKAIVDKTIDYSTKPDPGAWRREVMFISDEIESFKVASNQIAASIGEEGFVADKVYADPAISENAAHQNAIRSGIDDGRLIVHFLGHGGRFIWRTGPADLKQNNDLFTLKDVDSLSNGGRLPMVMSMTCYSAPFDNPTEDSIGEKFLREPGKGAIAVFAASWRNAPSPRFSKSVMDALLEPGATIGEAIVRGKKDEADRTLVEMYNLLGDPAVVLARPHDPVRVAYDRARFNRAIDIDIGSVHGSRSVMVDWTGTDGMALPTASYTVDTPRFRLAVPANATAVRVYAGTQDGKDAIGGLTLTPEEATPSLSRRLASWWQATKMDWRATAKTRSPDTISMFGFENDDAANTAAHAAAMTAANSQASSTKR